MRFCAGHPHVGQPRLFGGMRRDVRGPWSSKTVEPTLEHPSVRVFEQWVCARAERHQPVREARAEDDLELQTLGLVHSQDLHCVFRTPGGVGVVDCSSEESIQRRTNVRQ